jgi:hypothetical protein
MHCVLAWCSDKERAIGPLDEGHHADEADIHLIRGSSINGCPDTRTCGGDAAERNSTNEITTIHW